MGFELTLLETSDVHGNVFPLNYGSNQSADVGLAKMATLIKKERQKNPNIILIDNGDVIQGTPLTYHYARYKSEEANPMVLLLNELQYDAAVFGNHEFNFGLPLLKQAVEESRFPWLSANLLKEHSKDSFLGQPYLIKTLDNGLKVGILGLTTHYIPNWEKEDNIKGIEFQDALEAAKKWVPKLRPQVDILVVAYHGGFEKDIKTGEDTEVQTGENQGYQICEALPQIDVLLTGHQHRSIEAEEINGVTIVQPSSQGMALGKVVIKLEQKSYGWKITEKSSELLKVTGVPADEAILKQLAEYEKETQVWLDQPIGKIKGDMEVQDPMSIRTKDHPLIEFFNKIQMETAGVDISCTALFDNRSPGLPRNVTMRDVVANYIYPNTLRVIRVSGADIKAALEKSASYFALYNGKSIEVNEDFTTPKPQHYNYDMWEGLEYEINISRPAGERITKLIYQGKPLKMDEQYDVVMNNYRSGGGGDYLMFKDKSVIKDILIDVSELIANYILERGTIEASVNNNWRVVFDE